MTKVPQDKKRVYDAARYLAQAERKKAMVKAYRQTPRGKETRNAAGKRNRDRMKALLAEIKSAPCMDCGGKFPPYVMDFDHRHGVKKTEVAYMAQGNYSMQTVLDEIAKCEIVCANCHRIRTYGKKT